MALSDIEVPLYDSQGKDIKYRMIVNEFAGRFEIEIYNQVIHSDNLIVSIGCYFEDLERAWKALKRY